METPQSQLAESQINDSTLEPRVWLAVYVMDRKPDTHSFLDDAGVPIKPEVGIILSPKRADLTGDLSRSQKLVYDPASNAIASFLKRPKPQPIG
jgi:hypothetical protein